MGNDFAINTYSMSGWQVGFQVSHILPIQYSTGNTPLINTQVIEDHRAYTAVLFTRNVVLLYKPLIVSMTGPYQPPFIILWNRIWRLMRSNALAKSTKHTTRSDPTHNCRWIIPCKINMLSEVRQPARKPPIILLLFIKCFVNKLESVVNYYFKYFFDDWQDCYTTIPRYHEIKCSSFVDGIET